MARLAALVSVGAGPAAQPLGEAHLAGLLVDGVSMAVRKATLAAQQEAYGGSLASRLGWD